MEFPKVKPANRPGGWDVEGVGYRRQAHLCLRSFEQKNTLLQKHMKRLEEARKEGVRYKIPTNLYREIPILPQRHRGLLGNGSGGFCELLRCEAPGQ